MRSVEFVVNEDGHKIFGPVRNSHRLVRRESLRRIPPQEMGKSGHLLLPDLNGLEDAGLLDLRDLKDRMLEEFKRLCQWRGAARSQNQPKDLKMAEATIEKWKEAIEIVSTLIHRKNRDA